MTKQCCKPNRFNRINRINRKTARIVLVRSKRETVYSLSRKITALVGATARFSDRGLFYFRSSSECFLHYACHGLLLDKSSGRRDISRALLSDTSDSATLTCVDERIKTLSSNSDIEIEKAYASFLYTIIKKIEYNNIFVQEIRCGRVRSDSLENTMSDLWFEPSLAGIVSADIAVSARLCALETGILRLMKKSCLKHTRSRNIDIASVFDGMLFLVLVSRIEELRCKHGISNCISSGSSYSIVGSDSDPSTAIEFALLVHYFFDGCLHPEFLIDLCTIIPEIVSFRAASCNTGTCAHALDTIRTFKSTRLYDNHEAEFDDTISLCSVLPTIKRYMHLIVNTSTSLTLHKELSTYTKDGVNTINTLCDSFTSKAVI
jgi:hypothetical protein